MNPILPLGRPFLVLVAAAIFLVACSKDPAASQSSAEKKSASKSVISVKESGGGGSGKKGEKRVRTQEPPERTRKARPAVPVKLAALRTGDISASLVFDSVLETESSVEIFSESQGVILEVLAEVGDRVKKGQVLARLENDEQQLDAEESKTRYEQEQLSFKRTEDLKARKLVNQQEFERASFSLDQARLRYERSAIQLENTIVRATVDGVVTERTAQVGRRVTANKLLFEVMNLDELFASVNAPGRHLLSIAQGLPAKIDSDLIDGVSYEAYVKIVSPVVDPESGTFKTKVAVRNDDNLPIYPGMFVNVRIIVDTRKDVVLVPKEAVVHEGDLKYVYRVRNDRAQKILLQEGYSSLEEVESLHEFEAGDQVIVLGQSALKDGAFVKAVTETLTAEETDEASQAAAEG